MTFANRSRIRAMSIVVAIDVGGLRTVAREELVLGRRGRRRHEVPLAIVDQPVETELRRAAHRRDRRGRAGSRRSPPNRKCS